MNSLVIPTETHTSPAFSAKPRQMQTHNGLAQSPRSRTSGCDITTTVFHSLHIDVSPCNMAGLNNSNTLSRFPASPPVVVEDGRIVGREVSGCPTQRPACGSPCEAFSRKQSDQQVPRHARDKRLNEDMGAMVPQTSCRSGLSR